MGRGSGTPLEMPTIKCLFKGCNETHEIFVAKNGRPYINCSATANKFWANNDRSKSMLTGSVRSNPALGNRDHSVRTVVSTGRRSPVVFDGDDEIDVEDYL